jgi:hypothetical protein
MLGKGEGIPIEVRGVTGKRKDGDCFRAMKRVKRVAFLS